MRPPRILFSIGETTMSLSLFIQGIINGLNQGAIYALIALGYTMVYGIIRMINFAHGDFIMIGAYTLFYTIPLMVNAGMPAWLAVTAAIVVCALVGVLVETLAYRPVRKAGPMSALITALAMSIFLENLAMVLFGAKPHNVAAIFTLPTITVGAVSLPLNVLLTIAILLVEQNAKMALSISDRAYVLETGTISIEGSAKDLLNDPRVKKAYLGQ